MSGKTLASASTLETAVRGNVANGGNCDAAATVGKLIAALGSEDRLVRKEAVIALGKIGPAAKAAIAPLASLTDEPIVGYHARTALARIGAP